MSRDNDIQGNHAVAKPSRSLGFTHGGTGALPKHSVAPIAITTMRTSKVLTDAVSKVVVSASSGRNYLLLQNTGAVDIFLGFGCTPNVNGDGAITLAVGNVLSFDAGVVPNNEINAVSVGQGILNYIDGVRQ